MRRGDAEEDPTHKQVIPYLVLRDGERWFLMRRTRAGGDARLHDRWSIGVGGHLNPGDGDVAGGLRREWAEELVADFEPVYVPVGLLNDDTTAVGVGPRRPRLRRGRRRAAGHDPRDRQARGSVRHDGGCRRGPRRSRDMEPPCLRRADRVTPGSGGPAGDPIRTWCDTAGGPHEPHVAASPPPARPHRHAGGRPAGARRGHRPGARPGPPSCNSPPPASWTARWRAISARASPRAAADGAAAVVVQLDTPGGSITAMNEIKQAFLEAPLPVIVWVAPSGARAASAGTFITLAAHLAYMAPATNIGAAAPVEQQRRRHPGDDGREGPRGRDRVDPGAGRGAGPAGRLGGLDGGGRAILLGEGGAGGGRGGRDRRDHRGGPRGRRWTAGGGLRHGAGDARRGRTRPLPTCR